MEKIFSQPQRHQPYSRPIPIIDLNLCDGCGLCVQACPTSALAVREDKALVANPENCDYSELCEAVCPTQAISRPFEIIIAPTRLQTPSTQEN